MDQDGTSRAAELRRFVADTLAAASREILAAVDRLVAELEGEAAGLRRKVARSADATCRRGSGPVEEDLENLDLTSPSRSLPWRCGGAETTSDSFHDHEKRNHIQLRVRILDDPRTTVLSNSVLRRCPVYRLWCRPGQREADFTLLLRTRFPPPARDDPFDVLTSDRRRRLRPLKLKRLTPEEIQRSSGGSWSTRSTIYIRPKGARPRPPVLSDGTLLVPRVLEEPAGVQIQPISSSNQEVCEESGRPVSQTVPAVNDSGMDRATAKTSGTEVDQSDGEARETSELESNGTEGGEPGQDRKTERTEGKPTMRSVEVWQGLPGPPGPAGPASNDGRAVADSPGGPDGAEGVGGIKLERDLGDVSCKVCRLSHVSETALVEHVWTRHTGEPDNVCGVCGRASESADLLKEHLQNLHGFHHRDQSSPGVTRVVALTSEEVRRGEEPTAKRHRCRVCHQEFSLREQLKVHRRNHSNSKSHVCGVCGKSLSDYRSLSRHMMIHSEERPHACQLCGKQFKLVGTLRQHEKIHTARQRSFLCDVCCKMFLTSQQLHDHMMTHGEQKLHHCMQCGRGFIKKGALTVHQRVHTRDTPYCCPHCGWAFRWKSNLVEHLKVHSGAKPFVCAICGKACARKVYLTVHMRTHNGERPYKCSVCEKVFTQSHCLKTHMRSHQGASPAPRRQRSVAGPPAPSLKSH